MSDASIVEIRQEHFLEINGTEVVSVEVGERQFEVVEVAVAGPQGPVGPMPDMNADLVAYFILANS